MVRINVIRRQREGVAAGGQGLVVAGQPEEDAGSFDQVAGAFWRIAGLESQRLVEIMQRGGPLRWRRVAAVGVQESPGAQKGDPRRRVVGPFDGPTEGRGRQVKMPPTLL